MSSHLTQSHARLCLVVAIVSLPRAALSDVLSGFRGDFQSQLSPHREWRWDLSARSQVSWSFLIGTDACIGSCQWQHKPIWWGTEIGG